MGIKFEYFNAPCVAYIAALEMVHELARECGVSYGIVYEESANSWYAHVNSSAPSEETVTKSRSLSMVLEDLFDHLNTLRIITVVSITIIPHEKFPNAYSIELTNKVSKEPVRVKGYWGFMRAQAVALEFLDGITQELLTDELKLKVSEAIKTAFKFQPYLVETTIQFKE